MKCGTRDQSSGRSDDRRPAPRTQITSDAGLLAHRGLDAAIGLTDLAGRRSWNFTGAKTPGTRWLACFASPCSAPRRPRECQR